MTYEKNYEINIKNIPKTSWIRLKKSAYASNLTEINQKLQEL